MSITIHNVAYLYSLMSFNDVGRYLSVNIIYLYLDFHQFRPLFQTSKPFKQISNDNFQNIKNNLYHLADFSSTKFAAYAATPDTGSNGILSTASDCRPDDSNETKLSILNFSLNRHFFSSYCSCFLTLIT